MEGENVNEKDEEQRKWMKERNWREYTRLRNKR